MDIATRIEKAKQLFEQEGSRYIENWKAFLRFRSISTDKSFDPECRQCAEWLVSHLKGLGLESRLLETHTKPVVFGEYKGKADAPVVIFYGHYDVQPVDPVEDWVNDPFDPHLRDGRLYARGAEDNKGQVSYFLAALESLIRAGVELPTIRIFIEGEEESGGAGIEAACRTWEELKGDVLMVCDTGMAVPWVPTIVMGLRGIVGLNLTMKGPKYDLHSGLHGGVAPNPATLMARLIATLHNPDGSVAVEGFYDQVEEPTKEISALANGVPFDEREYKETTGVAPIGGEQRFTPWERVGMRPTIEVNGLHSGYGGPGGKTIIPSMAEAKLTCRLVSNQDADQVLLTVKRHLERHAPRGVELEIEMNKSSGGTLSLSPDSEVVKKARQVLDLIGASPAVLHWEGGSIPIIAELARVSGATPLLVGFGLEEDRIHAPNESFSLRQFEMGFVWVWAYLGGEWDLKE